MKRDVWFTRVGDQLYVAVAIPGQEPRGHTRACSSVNKVYRWAKHKGYEIAEVGIVPPEMLGLE